MFLVATLHREINENYKAVKTNCLPNLRQIKQKNAQLHDIPDKGEEKSWFAKFLSHCIYYQSLRVAKSRLQIQI